MGTWIQSIIFLKPHLTIVAITDVVATEQQLVTRQGGYDRVQKTVTFPVAFKSIAYSVVATLARGDEEAAQTWNYTATDFYLYQRYGDRWAHWVAIGLGQT